jgi:arsenical pump membrane protein
MIKKSGGNGKRLFFSVFLVSSAITLFTSNDIVILTLTPIIFYFSRHTGLNPLPYLVTEFFAANLWSTVFYFGNPTNIIAADASGIGFLQFTYWLALPTIAGGLVCLTLLYLKFRKSIPAGFEHMPHVRPEKFLKDKRSAVVTSAVFISAIAGMALSSYTGIHMWAVAALAAAFLFLYDSISSVFEKLKGEGFYRGIKGFHFGLDRKYEARLHMIWERMPWKVVPFLAFAFIMTEGLAAAGLVDWMASAITSVSTGVFPAAISMGFLSSLAANLMNNQPMTVLFTKLIESQQFLLAGNVRLASIFSLIIGSNLGANFTLIGALAGIMWAKILSGAKNPVSYKTFAKIGFSITPFVVLAVCVMLALEFFLAEL